MPQQLHKDAEGIVRRGHACVLHLLERLEGVVDAVLLRASVEDGIVHDLVRRELSIAFHLLQDVEGAVDIPFDAVALDDGGVGDDVRLHAALRHVLEELRGPGHGARLRASVQHRVVRNRVARDALGPHLLVADEDLVDALRHGEALEHCGVDHGVDASTSLFVLELLVDQLPSLVRLVVHHERLHHAAQGDRGGFHAVLLHLVPQLRDPESVPGLTVGLDHGAVRGSGEVHEAALVPVPAHQVREEVQLLDADAGLDHRGEEHLVDRLLDVLDQSHDTAHILGVGVHRERLQEDGARHGVRLHAGALHLLENAPHAATVLGDHLRVKQLVEGDLVGLQAAAAHLFDQGPRLVGMTPGEVHLQHRVVPNDVDEVQLLHLFEVRGCALDVTALHASVEEAIEDQRRELHAALPELAEDRGRSAQVALFGVALDERRLPLQLARASALARARTPSGAMLREALRELRPAELSRGLRQRTREGGVRPATTGQHLCLAEVASALGAVARDQRAAGAPEEFAAGRRPGRAREFEGLLCEVTVDDGPAAIEQRHSQALRDRHGARRLQLGEEVTEPIRISSGGQRTGKDLVGARSERHLQGRTGIQELPASGRPRLAPLPREDLLEVLRLGPRPEALQLLRRREDTLLPRREGQHLRRGARWQRALRLGVHGRGHLPQVAQRLVEAATLRRRRREDGAHARRQRLAGQTRGSVRNAEEVLAPQLRSHKPHVGRRVCRPPLLLQQRKRGVEKLHGVIPQQRRGQGGDAIE
mmetsp:Transcript_60427/g.174343  ORF Transcript_60427/g.174343 Transcript_60427/m.174343 type:complete len:763 (+) Transcript_60427:578-2866(+)